MTIVVVIANGSPVEIRESENGITLGGDGEVTVRLLGPNEDNGFGEGKPDLSIP